MESQRQNSSPVLEIPYKHPKIMLSDAFKKAQTAVFLDTSNDITGAIHAYTTACSLLEKVIVQLPAGEYQDKLRMTYQTYFDRIQLLTNVHSTQTDDVDVLNDLDAGLTKLKEWVASAELNNASINESSDKLTDPLFSLPYSTSTPRRCVSDISKKSFPMEYIRQISFSDINLLTPIKYLFKPIKEIISPISSHVSSPVQIDNNNSVPNFDLQNLDLDAEHSNSCNEDPIRVSTPINNRQLFYSQENDSSMAHFDWSPPLDSPLSFKSCIVSQNAELNESNTQTNSPKCEETNIAPFLRTNSEHFDKSSKNIEYDVEKSNMFQANHSQEKINTHKNYNESFSQNDKEKSYTLSYSNSKASSNFSNKSAGNILHTKKLTKAPRSSSTISLTPLLPISLNKTEHESIYLSLLYNNIPYETTLHEKIDPIDMKKPEDHILRTYWLMEILKKALMSFIINSKGFHITSRLFIPKDIWYVKDVKLKGEEEKIRVCESLILTLDKIKSLNQNDFQSLIKEISYLDNMVDIFRLWFLKKYVIEVVEPKKRFTVIKFTSKSKFLIKTSPPERFNIPLFGIVQFDGPRKMYLTSIYRLLESGQIIGKLNSLDFSELPFKAQDHIRQMLKNISDFFENVICHFILVDIHVLLDHYVKQLLYGNDYNSIIGSY